jgi:mycothiol system anti-sigma-R factor
MKDRCEETLAELYTYLDGELTVEIRERIRFHLDDCPPCGEIAVFETELRRVIATRCIDRVPDELRARILKACSGEPEPA